MMLEVLWVCVHSIFYQIISSNSPMQIHLMKHTIFSFAHVCLYFALFFNQYRIYVNAFQILRLKCEFCQIRPHWVIYQLSILQSLISSKKKKTLLKEICL